MGSDSDSDKSSGSGSDQAEDEYVVEKIVNKKWENGQWMYFIKWEGWPEEDNTWEPKSNLNCPEKLKKFEEKWKAKHGDKKKPGVKEPGSSKKREPEKKRKLKESSSSSSSSSGSGSDSDSSSTRRKKLKLKEKKRQALLKAKKKASSSSDSSSSSSGSDSDEDSEAERIRRKKAAAKKQAHLEKRAAKRPAIERPKRTRSDDSDDEDSRKSSKKHKSETVKVASHISKKEKSQKALEDLRKELEKVSGRKPQSKSSTISDADSTRPDSTTTIDLKGDVASKPIEVNKSEIKGVDRGLVAEEIVGAIQGKSDVMFLMKWKGCDAHDLVPRKEANIRCPQVVIAFYQSRLKWISKPNPNMPPSQATADKENDEDNAQSSTNVEKVEDHSANAETVVAT